MAKKNEKKEKKEKKDKKEKKGKKGKEGKGKKKVDCKIDFSKPPPTSGDEDCDDDTMCTCDCDCSPEVQPCYIQPTIPVYSPDAYDEFEACLNGSGLTIRVLKDTHKVKCVDDGAGADSLGADDDPCYSQDVDDCNPKRECLNDLLQRSAFARNHIKRRTGGAIQNHPGIPKIRANMKYSGNDTCETDHYYVPFSKIKEVCQQQDAKVDCYRRRLCGKPPPDTPAQPPAQNQRDICMQVQRQDIVNTMKGVNDDARRKGIEVCYKTCDETDSDVFLVKLGSKSKCQKKRNTIEIELRTPKQPVILPSHKVTTETYVTESMLDGGGGGGKKGKKGKGGKGKGKGKGKKKK